MTITEVSKKYELSADTLRYYERIGLLPNVARTPGGIRSFSEQDCAWVEFIKCMRGAGLPIEVLIEYVALFQEDDGTISARKLLLIEQRDALAERVFEMQKTLERLNYKIENYENVLLPAQKEITKKC